MNSVDRNLKFIVFKACVAAVWTDSSMSSDERRYLSHLTETLGETEEEREILRGLTLQDVNEGLLLAEIEQLDKADRIYIFDTCLDILVSDRRICVRESDFLATLRKTCGIGCWSYWRKLFKARRNARARIIPSFRTRLLVLVVAVLAGVVPYMLHRYTRIDITPEEVNSGREIAVSILPANGAKPSTQQTAQGVFEQVRNSIVSVTVFVNHDPVCSGSGWVVGNDESGDLYVLTNKHVILNSLTSKGWRGDWVRMEVKQHSGAKFEATFDFYSRQHDIAILAVKGMEEYAQPLKMTLKKSLRVGQPVYAIGSPIGLDPTLTTGVISALRESYLQTDATVHSGSSGGPLVDQRGAVCAVVTRSHRVKNYSFAQYCDVVLEVLDERKKLMGESTDEEGIASQSAGATDDADQTDEDE